MTMTRLDRGRTILVWAAAWLSLAIGGAVLGLTPEFGFTCVICANVWLAAHALSRTQEQNR